MESLIRMESSHRFQFRPAAPGAWSEGTDYRSICVPFCSISFVSFRNLNLAAYYNAYRYEQIIKDICTIVVLKRSSPSIGLCDN